MVHWKNFLIKGFVRLLQYLARPGNTDHFLVVSTTGLGDTLWGTPAIRALRETYPKSYIGCLTSSLGAEVLKSSPYLNELLVFKKPSILSLLKLYFQLRRRKIGTAFFFHTSQRALLPLCASLGIERRIGTAGLQKGLDELLTEAMTWKSGHEIERRLSLIRAAQAHPRSYEMDFFIQESDRQVAAQLVPEPCVIGLHPGAKDRFKQWPASYFVKVGNQLKKELGCTILVTGASSEKWVVESICRQIEGARGLMEPLATMAAVLERMSFFITNDTGPLHLALAMKTPTLALFTPTNPDLCGPYHQSAAHILRAEPTCFPCLKKKCRDPFCLRQLSPDQVIAAVLAQWKVAVCK